ncbi:MAG: ester cyclase [Pseudomonadota bacterium]
MEPAAAREALTPLRAALRDMVDVPAALAHFAPGAEVHLCHPFETMPAADYAAPLAALTAALPDVERHELIVMAGPDAGGAVWVGICGNWVGTFAAPLLGIPPTGRAVHMRFHEFYRMGGRRIAELQALWDLPELMLQAGAWPLAPSLGTEGRVPGPALGDGLHTGPWRDGAGATALVDAMVAGLLRHAEGGPKAMELDRFWHPKMAWYGPAGIGQTRGIAGFRQAHQIPWLGAMPDRTVRDETPVHLFGEGDFAGFTAWPGLHATLSAGTFLGLPGAGQEVEVRSLDFWRCEGGVLRENWVLVDILHMADQLGLDVLARAAELTAPRRDPGLWLSGAP